MPACKGGSKFYPRSSKRGAFSAGHMCTLQCTKCPPSPGVLYSNAVINNLLVYIQKKTIHPYSVLETMLFECIHVLIAWLPLPAYGYDGQSCFVHWSSCNTEHLPPDTGIVYTLRSRVDERHMKFVVSLSLNTAQRAEAKGTLPKVPMPWHPPVLVIAVRDE